MTGVIQEVGGQEIHFFDLMMQHQLSSDIPDTFHRFTYPSFSDSWFDSCSMIFNVQVSFWLLFHLCAANTDGWQGRSGPPCSWGAIHSQTAYSLNYIVVSLPWAENSLHQFLALLSACNCQTKKIKIMHNLELSPFLQKRCLCQKCAQLLVTSGCNWFRCLHAHYRGWSLLCRCCSW